MAKFKVLHCITERTSVQPVSSKGENGGVQVVMKQVTEPVSAGFFGVEDVSIGDVIEITEPRLVAKAQAHEWLEEVKARKKAKKKASS
jgi:hypothetical protein